MDPLDRETPSPRSDERSGGVPDIDGEGANLRRQRSQDGAIDSAAAAGIPGGAAAADQWSTSGCGISDAKPPMKSSMSSSLGVPPPSSSASTPAWKRSAIAPSMKMSFWAN